MTNPVESFVTTLARASKRGSYHLRGLTGADRDDVIATALAWCWENRAKYDPSQTLEIWFDAALREAKSQWFGQGKRKKRDATVTAVEFNERMAEVLPDPTAEAAEASDAARALLDALNPMDRAQVYLIARGLGNASPDLQRKLSKLRKLLPERHERISVIRAAAYPESDRAKSAPAPRIDCDLAALSQPQTAGADCPVCWKCCWYDHLLPRFYVRRTTTPADPEVQAAIWATEQRKIDIAMRLQAGSMDFTGVSARG